MAELKSGKELSESPVPTIFYRIESLLRANGGRMSITGQSKMKKSFLAMDLALRISCGDEWLSYSTRKGNVLYLNLEISEEKFHQRVQDLQGALKYKPEDLAGFQSITILDENLSLDDDFFRVQELLNECRNRGCRVDVLFIDPRARVIKASENDEFTIKGFCDNIDKLITENAGLSVVIVTHMGKDIAKGALGHSRFTGWLDTEVKIGKAKSNADKRIEIIGRDAEQTSFDLEFFYPLHNMNIAEQFIRNDKVEEAKQFIVGHLGLKPKYQQRLRRLALYKEISEYAFNRAIRELKQEKRIKSIKVKGPGNKRALKLIQE